MGNYKPVVNEPINPNLFLQRQGYKFLQITLIIKQHPINSKDNITFLSEK